MHIAPVGAQERGVEYVAPSAVPEGCRWAVVKRPNDYAVAFALDEAAHDPELDGAIPSITNMLEPHGWVER